MNGALTFQIQEQSPADHVLWLPVGLGPVPGGAKPLGESTTPFIWMIGNHLPDKSNVGGRKSWVSESERIFHA